MLKIRNDLKDISTILLTGIWSLDHSSRTPLETPGNINQENKALVWHQAHHAVPNVTDYITHSCKVALFGQCLLPIWLFQGKAWGPGPIYVYWLLLKNKALQMPKIQRNKIQVSEALKFLIMWQASLFHSSLYWFLNSKWKGMCVWGGSKGDNTIFNNYP